ncbi:MAG: T9SS type A sorting domain-containing protein [Prolixibacteraceae bacterium]
MSHFYNRDPKTKAKSVAYFTFLILCLSPFFLQAQSNNQGFFLDSWLPKTIQVSACDTVTLVTDAATVNIVVDVDSIITKVSKYVYGHNAAAWGGKLEQSALLVESLTELAPNIIRWPGGSMSDDYFWKATSQETCPKDLPSNYTFADLKYGLNNNGWTMSTDSYYELLKKTNSTGIITVNYGYARLGTSDDPVLTAAKYAADWVRYDKGKTRYWEIGNEDFGSWENGYSIDVSQNKDGQPKINSGDLYGKHCRVFIEEMKKAAREIGNDIKIGVVAMDSHVTYDAVQRDWNKGMMAQVADVADYIIVHSYYTPYQENSTIATILNSPDKTINMNQYINDGLKTNANHAPLPMALTEWNIFAEGSGQQVSYINGMHAALILGELIKNNYGQGSRWDLMNGWGDGNSHGLYADGEPGIARYTPRAPFFYMYYFQKFFGDQMIHSSVSGNSNVKAYASKFSSGQSGLVLVNKNTTDQVANVTMKNFKPGNRYYYYVLTGGTDNGKFSRKVFVNGKTTVNEGGGPADYATILPYGAEIDGDIQLKLPALSTVYVLVESSSKLMEQTIQFNAIPAKVVGDSDFEISATSSSNLPVQFASKNPDVAVVQNNTIHIVGTGTCEIVAFQGGDTVYQTAPQLIQSFLVAKGDQTITFTELPEITFGDDPVVLEASATSGLSCTFVSSRPGIAAIVDNQLKINAAGTITITAKQEGNIDFNAASEVSQEIEILDQTSFTQQSKLMDFSVYPNPASTLVSIKMRAENNRVFIYNSIGVLVYSRLTSNAELIVPTSKLGESGVFYVKVNAGVKKLIIL